MFLYPRPTWVLNWHTPAGSGVGPWGFCTWQPILVYGKDPYMANGMGSRPDVIVHTESAEKNGHPCPKPEKLWSKLLNRVSVLDTDIVFDCFMGSGTTALVAEKKQLKWFGCELEPKYCEIANRRIEAERAQLKLFI
jgi:DNA modification methylase